MFNNNNSSSATKTLPTTNDLMRNRTPVQTPITSGKEGTTMTSSSGGASSVLQFSSSSASSASTPLFGTSQSSNRIFPSRNTEAGNNARLERNELFGYNPIVSNSNSSYNNADTGLRQRRSTTEGVLKVNTTKPPPSLPKLTHVRPFPMKPSRLTTARMMMESPSLIDETAITSNTNNGVDNPVEQTDQMTKESMSQSPFVSNNPMSSIFSSLRDKKNTIATSTTTTPSNVQQQTSSAVEYSKWIVAYGFTNSKQCNSILKRFETFGTITSRYPRGGDSIIKSNWICLQYDSTLQADKATCQHGCILDAKNYYNSSNNKTTSVGKEVIILGVMRVDVDVALRLGLRNHIEFGSNISNDTAVVIYQEEDKIIPTSLDNNGNEEEISQPRVLLQEDDVLLQEDTSSTNKMVEHDKGLFEYILAWVFTW